MQPLDLVCLALQTAAQPDSCIQNAMSPQRPSNEAHTRKNALYEITRNQDTTRLGRGMPENSLLRGVLVHRIILMDTCTAVYLPLCRRGQQRSPAQQSYIRIHIRQSYPISDRTGDNFSIVKLLDLWFVAFARSCIRSYKHMDAIRNWSSMEHNRILVSGCKIHTWINPARH